MRTVRVVFPALPLVLALAWAAPAGAVDLCVGTVAGSACGGGTFAGDGTGLQSALNAAAGGGEDRVLVGPGTYSRAAGFSYFSASRVEIAGAGTTQTRLTGDCSNPTLRMTPNAASLLHDVTLAQPGSATCQQAFLGEGVLRDIVVDYPAGPEAVRLGEGALQRSVVNAPLGPEGVFAVRSVAAPTATPLTISDSIISGRAALSIEAGAETVRVSRTRVNASSTGVSLGKGVALVEDSLVRMTGGTALSASSTSGGPTTLDTSHLTLICVPACSGTAVRSSVFGPDNAQVFVRNVVGRGFSEAFAAPSSGGGTATVTVLRSDVAGSSPGGPAVQDGDNVPGAPDPRFVDPANGDFRLRFDSPLVDVGQTVGLLSGESSTDLAGGDRIVNGRRDIGAFEYQRRRPSISSAANANPSPAAVGQPILFSGAASDADPGEALTYEWTFSDGTALSGQSVSKAFSTPGTHFAVLHVTDPTGLGLTTTVSLTVVATVCCAPQPDRRAPTLSDVSLLRATFRVGSAATPVAGAAAKRKPAAKKGTAFRYKVSEPSSVTIAIQRAAKGRRSGSKCVKATTKNRKAKKCTRYVAAGRLRRTTSAAGRLRSVAFSGRIGTKALPVGRYRATVGARDPAGNSARPRILGFTVVR